MQVANYVRLWADEEGESHFQDVEVTLEAVDFAPPAPPLHFKSIGEATSIGFLGGDPAWGGDVPHPTPRRQVMCPLSGQFEITASDGERRVFAAGSVLLLEDTHGKGHATRIIAAAQTMVVALA